MQDEYRETVSRSESAITIHPKQIGPNSNTDSNVKLQVVWFASEVAACSTSFTAHGLFKIDLQLLFSVSLHLERSE